MVDALGMDGRLKRGHVDMTRAEIYNLAMHELLRLRYDSKDAERAENGNKLSQVRLKRTDEKISELHDLIIEAEKNSL